MPETELVILILAVCLLALLVWRTGRISARLARIEARLSEVPAAAEPAENESASVEPSPGGLFESFLAEEPSRRALSKNEQVAAFRKRRKDKGRRWSGP